uniref:RNA polymerase beta subunit n=1 Tax=Edaphochlamys debaryana TaxID=47281 RepID=UPI0022A770D1|nr:RNA polymerase beta subunit [Edaphochlamys debaryana]UZS90725.1 RNA polymerase beta subunit [Edaphochlamys debaryana]
MFNNQKKVQKDYIAKLFVAKFPSCTSIKAHSSDSQHEGATRPLNPHKGGLDKLLNREAVDSSIYNFKKKIYRKIVTNSKKTAWSINTNVWNHSPFGSYSHICWRPQGTLQSFQPESIRCVRSTEGKMSPPPGIDGLDGTTFFPPTAEGERQSPVTGIRVALPYPRKGVSTICLPSPSVKGVQPPLKGGFGKSSPTVDESLLTLNKRASWLPGWTPSSLSRRIVFPSVDRRQRILFLPTGALFTYPYGVRRVSKQLPPPSGGYNKRGGGWALVFPSVDRRPRPPKKQYITYNLETYHRSNQDTCLIHKPIVKEGDWVRTGDLLADSASSIGGELAIGHNIIVAYMPWEGYNYEDAILINERLVYEDIYTSIHIERYEITTKETKDGFEQLTREIPDINENEISHLDKNGIAKIGSWVEEGDILVGKVTPFNVKTLTPQQKLLYKIFGKELSTTKDSSLRAPKGIKATVIKVNILAYQKNPNPPLSAKRDALHAKSGRKGGLSKSTTSSKKPVIKQKKITLTTKNEKHIESTPVKRGLVRGNHSTLVDVHGVGKKRRAPYSNKDYTPPKGVGLRLKSKLAFGLRPPEGGQPKGRPNAIKPLGESQRLKVPLQLQIKKRRVKHNKVKFLALKIQHKKYFNCLLARAKYTFANLAFSRPPVGGRKPKGRRAPLLKVKGGPKGDGPPSRLGAIMPLGLNELPLSGASLKKLPRKGGLVFNSSALDWYRTPGVLTKKHSKFASTSPSPKGDVLRTKGYEKAIPSYVHIYLAEKRKMQVGDKMAGRHGNKGIVSRILPRQDMPYLPDGTSVDIVLNPLGVPSRMNVGQIYECLLGLAGRYLGEHYKIPPFDEMYGPDASRSFVLAKLYEARQKTGLKWLFDANNPGKIRIFDGRNSESFDQTVTVGIAYVLKLVHMVDDKMHMRSTGPYSLVTQQPLRGRSKQGGQRLGEMEVWAIEGYGAAFVLSEMLTIKSDDMTGRQNLWKNLIENNDISLGSPESFKVLVCELQALCLDIGLFRKNISPRPSNPPSQGVETPTQVGVSLSMAAGRQEPKKGGPFAYSSFSAPNLIEIDSLLHLA